MSFPLLLSFPHSEGGCPARVYLLVVVVGDLVQQVRASSFFIFVVPFRILQGAEEAKQELQDVVRFLKEPERYTRLGAKIPKGVLLTGPPGTGKTLLARAVAGEAGVRFYAKSASEFEEMLVGMGARRVRELFDTAKKHSPAIIFIDEIDSMASKRRNISLSSSSERQTINQLLACMDGFEKNEGVVVIAATNAPESLDSAVTRPGRFDSKVRNGAKSLVVRFLRMLVL